MLNLVGILHIPRMVTFTFISKICLNSSCMCSSNLFNFIYFIHPAPEYNAPLFLDCCALVRQCLRDLKEDFGFDVGPWNQAYQYDTLPITIENEEDMKPGDLVFISGIYYNKKSKEVH